MLVELNRMAFEFAEELIIAGRFVFDERNAWSEHRPSAQTENEFLEAYSAPGSTARQSYNVGACVILSQRRQDNLAADGVMMPMLIVAADILSPVNGHQGIGNVVRFLIRLCLEYYLKTTRGARGQNRFPEP